MVPFMFVAKRILFVILCMYIKVETIQIMIFVTVVNLALILHTKPYSDEAMNKVESLNEVVAYLFFISILGFKGYITHILD